MSDLPSPLTPADCDLRGMPFMPVDLVRLFDSDIYALSTGDEFKAAFTLWGKAFLQVPAGSLPTDDRILAHLSGAGGNWRKVRDMALRGWVRCSDGRLYHAVVAEKAREAWEARVAQRARTEAARQARAQKRQSGDGNHDRDATQHATQTVAHSVTSSVTENVTGSKGQGQGQGIEDNPPSPPPLARQGEPIASQQGAVARRRNPRADGTSPRAVAAAEAAAERAARTPPAPDHPLWPRCRALDMAADEFRRWIVPLVEVASVDGVRVLVAPSRFHADHVRREFGSQHLAGFDIRANPEARHG